MHSVCILRSSSLDRYYTGYSADVDKRMDFHAHPEARKFTAKAKDWKLFCDNSLSNKKPGHGNRTAYQEDEKQNLY